MKCWIFVPRFLSSDTTHLDSRCLSQAVFDSSAVDFDTKVMRISSRGGLAPCHRSQRLLVPVPGSSAALGRGPTTAAEQHQPRATSGLMNAAYQQDELGTVRSGAGAAAGRAGGSARCSPLHSPVLQTELDPQWGQAASTECCFTPGLDPSRSSGDSSRALSNLSASSRQSSFFSGVWKKKNLIELQLNLLLLLVTARQSHRYI